MRIYDRRFPILGLFEYFDHLGSSERPVDLTARSEARQRYRLAVPCSAPRLAFNQTAVLSQPTVLVFVPTFAMNDAKRRTFVVRCILIFQ
jgi:hypothetical protein